MGTDMYHLHPSYQTMTLLCSSPTGMNQFKSIFLGTVDPSTEFAYLKRSVNYQKCIRAGGKHNDLDDVGKDTYHHTFFEMLGNWSFGDYFQTEAIDMAWELLTSVFGLDSSRLYATYFEGDEDEGLEPDLDASNLWSRYLPPDHILKGNKKDNFWEMGSTGPCGPSSELHYDLLGGRNAADKVNKEDPTVIEIWNLVFVQYSRGEDGSLEKLPLRHVDTGMGFERIVSVLQNKISNYDTDVFKEILDEIQKLTGCIPYGGQENSEEDIKRNIAYRIVSDHIRTLAIAISDGCVPGPTDRGYVLRRILKRAIRYGVDVLGAQQGFLSQLVPIVVQKLRGTFPPLFEAQASVIDSISLEEKRFVKSLALGKAMLKSITSKMQPGQVISGQDVYTLYSGFGFPDDLTTILAEEEGLRIDYEGFRSILEQSRLGSRSNRMSRQ